MKIRILVITSKMMSEYRSLIQNNEPGSVCFLDKTTCRINPFQLLKNVGQELLIADLSRILCIEMGLQTGSEVYLSSIVNELYQKNKDANFKDLQRYLTSREEKSFDFKGYKNRILARFNALLLEVGSIFDCIKGIQDEKFIKNNIILEIPGSASFITGVVSGIILDRMFRLKAHNTELRQYTNIIILEDIQASLLRSENEGTELPAFYWMANESRYLKIFMIFSVQSIKLLPQTIRENSSILITKRLNDYDEAFSAGKLMGFKDNEKFSALLNLKPQDTIFMNKQIGTIPVPVLTPLYKTEFISNEEIQIRQYEIFNRIIEDVIFQNKKEQKTPKESYDTLF